MTIKLLAPLRIASLAFIIMANPAQSAQDKQTEAQSSSRKAYIDESTGELISTPPDGPATIDAQNKTANVAKSPEEQGIEYITHPDGTVEGRLDGHYQSQLVVTLGCDGQLTQAHSSQGKQTLPTEPTEGCDEGE